MNDQRGEALSALLDGELDESERRRLLDRLASDEGLRSRWNSYGLIREIMRGEAMEVGDLAARVRAAVDDEPTVLAPAAPAGDRSVQLPRWARPAAGLALAASLATVAVLGGRSIDAGNSAVIVAGVATPAAEAIEDVVPSGPGTMQTVSMAAGATVAETSRGVAATERGPRWSVQQPAVQRRLDAYLINYSGQLNANFPGLLPYARVVGHEGKQR